MPERGEISSADDSVTPLYSPYQLKNDSSKPYPAATVGGSGSSQATFLASHNPAQVKRNVLAGFKDVLLLPVTIIPKTAVYVVSAGSTAAVSGLSMLNPQNWQGASSTRNALKTDKSTGLPMGHGKNDEINAAVFELGDDEDGEKAGSLNESESGTTSLGDFLRRKGFNLILNMLFDRYRTCYPFLDYATYPSFIQACLSSCFGPRLARPLSSSHPFGPNCGVQRGNVRVSATPHLARHSPFPHPCRPRSS